MSTLRVIVLHPLIFIMGVREAYSAFGMTYDDDTEGDRSRAYDYGRNVGERVVDALSPEGA
jgi:hypothetical protein